jgi:hypothetical protein
MNSYNDGLAPQGLVERVLGCVYSPSSSSTVALKDRPLTSPFLFRPPLLPLSFLPPLLFDLVPSSPSSIGTSLLLLLSGLFLQQALTIFRSSYSSSSSSLPFSRLSSRSTWVVFWSTTVLLTGYTACVWAEDYGVTGASILPLHHRRKQRNLQFDRRTVSQGRTAHTIRHRDALSNAIPLLSGLVTSMTLAVLAKQASKVRFLAPLRRRMPY